MFSKARILSIVLVLLFPLLAGAQSLGSVAKKERERREKNKAEGVTVRQISEDEVGTKDAEEEEAVEGAAPAEGDEVETSGGDSSARGPASPFSTTIDLTEQKRQSLDDEQAERRRQESQWKARSQQARDRLDTARGRVQQLEGLHLVEGERYVDANGNTVIASPEHLKRLVDQANAELEAAEQSLDELREEARRKGIPPGWLR
jgi:hypothetical protein